jgi:hypothetical protein
MQVSAGQVVVDGRYGHGALAQQPLVDQRKSAEKKKMSSTLFVDQRYWNERKGGRFYLSIKDD